MSYLPQILFAPLTARHVTKVKSVASWGISPSFWHLRTTFIAPLEIPVLGVIPSFRYICVRYFFMSRGSENSIFFIAELSLWQYLRLKTHGSISVKLTLKLLWFMNQTHGKRNSFRRVFGANYVGLIVGQKSLFSWFFLLLRAEIDLTLQRKVLIFPWLCCSSTRSCFD